MSKNVTSGINKFKTLKIEKPIINIYFYIYICILCLSVRLFPINVKTAEPIGSKIFQTIHITQRRFMDAQNISISKNLKIHEKNMIKSENLLLLFKNVYKEKMGAKPSFLNGRSLEFTWITLSISNCELCIL